MPKSNTLQLDSRQQMPAAPQDQCQQLDRGQQVPATPQDQFQQPMKSSSIIRELDSSQQVPIMPQDQFQQPASSVHWVPVSSVDITEAAQHLGLQFSMVLPSDGGLLTHSGVQSHAAACAPQQLLNSAQVLQADPLLKQGSGMRQQPPEPEHIDKVVPQSTRQGTGMQQQPPGLEHTDRLLPKPSAQQQLATPSGQQVATPSGSQMATSSGSQLETAELELPRIAFPAQTCVQSADQQLQAERGQSQSELQEPQSEELQAAPAQQQLPSDKLLSGFTEQQVSCIGGQPPVAESQAPYVEQQTLCAGDQQPGVEQRRQQSRVQLPVPVKQQPSPARQRLLIVEQQLSCIEQQLQSLEQQLPCTGKVVPEQPQLPTHAQHQAPALKQQSSAAAPQSSLQCEQLESPQQGLDSPQERLESPQQGLEFPQQGLDSPQQGLEAVKQLHASQRPACSWQLHTSFTQTPLQPQPDCSQSMNSDQQQKLDHQHTLLQPETNHRLQPEQQTEADHQQLRILETEKHDHQGAEQYMRCKSSDKVGVQHKPAGQDQPAQVGTYPSSPDHVHCSCSEASSVVDHVSVKSGLQRRAASPLQTPILTPHVFSTNASSAGNLLDTPPGTPRSGVVIPVHTTPQVSVPDVSLVVDSVEQGVQSPGQAQCCVFTVAQQLQSRHSVKSPFLDSPTSPLNMFCDNHVKVASDCRVHALQHLSRRRTPETALMYRLSDQVEDTDSDGQN